jgi:hypothetical protein
MYTPPPQPQGLPPDPPAIVQPAEDVHAVIKEVTERERKKDELTEELNRATDELAATDARPVIDSPKERGRSRAKR